MTMKEIMLTLLKKKKKNWKKSKVKDPLWSAQRTRSSLALSVPGKECRCPEYCYIPHRCCFTWERGWAGAQVPQAAPVLRRALPGPLRCRLQGTLAPLLLSPGSHVTQTITFMLFFPFFSQVVSYFLCFIHIFFTFSKKKFYQGQHYQVLPLTRLQQCPHTLELGFYMHMGVQCPAAGCFKGTILRDKWNLSSGIISLIFKKPSESWGHVEPECDELGEKFVSAN